MAMPRPSARSVRCFRWNLLVSNVALGISGLILAQLLLPSLAFVVLKQPPGQRTAEEDTPSPAEDDDDEESPKIQNIDLDLLRQHLIHSLGLPDGLHHMPQVRVSHEEIARAMETVTERAKESEKRQRRAVSSRSTTNAEVVEGDAANTQPTTAAEEAATAEDEEEQIYTYFAHGVAWESDSYRVQKLNFRLGNLTRVLRQGERSMTSRVLAAKLYLHRPAGDATTTAAAVNCPHGVFLYRQNSEQTGFTLIRQLATPTADVIQVDVLDSVRRWTRSNYRRTFFLLSCDKLEAGGGEVNGGWRRWKSRLEVRTRGAGDDDDDRYRRDKRFADYGVQFPFKEEASNCGNKEHNCCRKSVTITMKDLKLNHWVIHPKDFKFYYCKGKCRNATNQDNLHALIQHYMHQHGKHKKKLPKLCCTASKLREMQVVHLKLNPANNETELTVGKWRNILVERCDCA